MFIIEYFGAISAMNVENLGKTKVPVAKRRHMCSTLCPITPLRL